MFDWLKREAAVYREAFRNGHPIDAVRGFRNAAASDANALGSSVADVRRLSWCKDEVTAIPTKYGILHIRPQSSDWLVLRQVFIDGEYDFGSYPQMDKIKAAYTAMLATSDSPVIIDAGANIGAASLWFNKQFPAAKIIAVEPDPDNVALAVRNVAGINAIELKAAAIGGSTGVVNLGGPKEGGWGTQTIRSTSGIPVLTVNDIVASVQRGRLLIVKIDIEGFESDLFEANTEWVRDAVAIIVEPHDWLFPGKGTSQSLQRTLFGQGREMLIAGENLVFV